MALGDDEGEVRYQAYGEIDLLLSAGGKLILVLPVVTESTLLPSRAVSFHCGCFGQCIPSLTCRRLQLLFRLPLYGYWQ
jgi:hypothetical protein